MLLQSCCLSPRLPCTPALGCLVKMLFPRQSLSLVFVACANNHIVVAAFLRAFLSPTIQRSAFELIECQQ